MADRIEIIDSVVMGSVSSDSNPARVECPSCKKSGLLTLHLCAHRQSDSCYERICDTCFDENPICVPCRELIALEKQIAENDIALAEKQKEIIEHQEALNKMKLRKNLLKNGLRDAYGEIWGVYLLIHCIAGGILLLLDDPIGLIDLNNWHWDIAGPILIIWLVFVTPLTLSRIQKSRKARRSYFAEIEKSGETIVTIGDFVHLRRILNDVEKILKVFGSS